MSHYLIEQLAALPNVDVRTGSAAVAAEGEDGRLRAAARARRRRREDDARRRRLLRLHRRLAAHRLARGRRRARRARLHPRRARRAGRRLAAEARPLPARDERARRVRRRRRARALDQARGERRRRGLDGRLARSTSTWSTHERRAGHRWPTCGRSTCSTTSTTTQLAAVGRRSRAPRDVAAGRGARRAGRAAAGRACCCSRARAQALLVDGDRAEPVGRQRRADVDRRDRRAHRRRRSACGCRPRPPAASALIEPDDFRRLAFAQPAVHRRVMRQVGAGDEPASPAIEQNRERLASLGTMAAGLAHELNNPAAAAQRAAAQMAEALEVIGVDARPLRRVGRRARGGRAAASRCSRRRSTRRGGARRRSTRSTPPTPRTSCSTRLEDARRARAVADRRAARRRRRRPGVARPASPRLAGPATGAALALGRRHADRARPGGGAAGVDRADVRRSSARSRPTPTWTAASSSRSTCTRGSRRRSRSSATSSSTRRSRSCATTTAALPKLTVRGSELNQVWTNLLDNAIDALGDSGTITIATRRDGDCVEVDDRRRRARASRPRSASASSTRSSRRRTSASGTGLGLATARRIVVDRHDGSLTVDSEPGRTTFHVRLPLTQR